MMKTARETLIEVSNYGLIVFIPAIVASLILQIWLPVPFFRAYLIAYLYWFSLSMGCLAMAMIHGMTFGGWGLGIRRILEAGYETIPLMAILFLPIGLNVRKIYPWADASIVEQHEVLLRKAGFLNVTGYEWRSIGYFIIWMLIIWRLNQLSPGGDRDVDSVRQGQLQTSSGIGFVVFGFTVTLAMVDWVMSLEPLWYSTMYGLVIMAGMGLNGLALGVVVASRLAHYLPWHDSITATRLNDLGNLLLAGVMFWAYCAFFQFLVIWSGNLPEETSWYIKRSGSGWQWLAVALILFHFFVPFLLLLSRDLKRKPISLTRIAILLLVMHFIDLYWIVAPAFGPLIKTEPLHIHWLDIFLPVAVGSGWIMLFTRRLAIRSEMPLYDPEVSVRIHERTKQTSFA